MKVINPETNKEVRHFLSVLFNSKKKNTEAAIMAIVPMKKETQHNCHWQLELHSRGLVACSKFLGLRKDCLRMDILKLIANIEKWLKHTNNRGYIILYLNML